MRFYKTRKIYEQMEKQLYRARYQFLPIVIRHFVPQTHTHKTVLTN